MQFALLCAAGLTIAACDRQAQSHFPAHAAADRLPLEVCEFEGADEPFLCGIFEVYENRQERSGKTIPIKVVVIPAQSERHTQSAWIEHQGGPRFSMVASAPLYAEGGPLERFRRHRDIVLMDPRGLHESGPLYCDALKEIRIFEPYYPSERIRACREELEKTADLAQYSTLNAIDDFEDIRKWLGYEQWDVGGWSFGSRFMLTYIHRYPESIRTASLVIPSILNFDRPLNYARFGQQALDRLIADCEADAECFARFPDIQGDLDMVLAALNEQAATLEFVDPVTGEQTSRQLIAGVFAEHVWESMLYGNLARQLPLMIHQAAQGDFDLFLNTFVPLEPQPAEPDGHYWSVVCPEETSRLEPEEVIAAAQGTFLGTYTSDEYIAACQEWGLPVHPGHPIEAQTFNIPALVITGDQDPATPPQYGREIVSHFEGGLHINVPHMGHGGSTVQNAECLDQILADFVDRGTTEGLDTTCVETIRPHPFRLD